MKVGTVVSVVMVGGSLAVDLAVVSVEVDWD
jgi:hypothetical protein